MCTWNVDVAWKGVSPGSGSGGLPMSLADLQRYVLTLPPGPVSDCSTLEQLLSSAWNEISVKGDDEGLEAYKLLDRLESVTWQPPCINFKIERHGGTFMG